MSDKRYALTKGKTSLHNFCRVCGKRIAILLTYCSPDCETIDKVSVQNEYIRNMRNSMAAQEDEIKLLQAAVREERQKHVLGLSEPMRLLHQQTQDEDWKKMTWVHQLVLGSTHWNFNGEGVSDGA